MEKRQKKDIKPSGFLSLKELTKSIRNIESVNTEGKEESEKKENVTIQAEDTISVEESLLKDDFNLQEWITKAKRIKNNSEEPVKMLYINEDIVEVFSVIKKEGKVSMKNLITAILENWIITHAEEIKALSKKNRFL